MSGYPTILMSSNVAFPNQWLYTDGVSAKTQPALFTTGDISSYSHGLFVISGLTGETVAVTALVDGTVASGALKIQKTDGTYVAGSALSNGTFYLLDIAAKNLVFTKSSNTEAATVTLAMKA